MVCGALISPICGRAVFWAAAFFVVTSPCMFPGGLAVFVWVLGVSLPGLASGSVSFVFRSVCLFGRLFWWVFSMVLFR